jgi:mycofactocin precursor
LEPTTATEETTAVEPVVEPADDDVVDELLVEEISIDGMCGVY